MKDNFHYLERTDVKDKIAKIEEVPLMLITAPMGYGKSTCVREYLQNEQKTTIWITLGQNPVQEEWLWNRVAQEVEKVNAPLAHSMRKYGIPYSCDWDITEENLLTAMRQAFTRQAMYVVLDDYQSCNGENLNRFLTKLAYEDITGAHVILISRSHIDMPLMELQMKGYCVLINQADLVMSPEQTRQLFEINGIALEEEKLRDIYEYTDGWIAASRLLWLDYQKTGNLQASGSVPQLLKESIYEQLEEEQKLLLYPFSCFPELSLEELSEICQKTVTGTVMDGLIEKTGLMHFNLQNHKYAIHTLLHATVVNEDLGNKEEIYKRYARWQKKNGNYVAAVENFYYARDRKEILQILEEETSFEIKQQIPDLLLNFFQECQNCGELWQYPVAVFTYVYALLMSADEKVLQQGMLFYTFVREHYEQIEMPTQQEKDLLGELCIINALVVFNDLEAANAALEEAWSLRNEKSSRIFAKKNYSYGVPNTLYMYHKETGKLSEEVEQEIEFSRQYMRLIYSTQSSLEKLIHAEYALETGDLEQAQLESIAALKKAEYYNQICIILSGYLVLFRCLIAQGNKSGFEEAMERCVQYVEEMDSNSTILTSEFDLLQGHVYAVLGQLDKVPLWIRSRQIENCNLIVRDTRNAGIVYGTYLCHKKRWRRLEVNAEEMMLPYADTKHVFAEIYANLFYAIAAWNGDACEPAREHLLKALALAEPDQIMMPFAELSEFLFSIWQSLEVQSEFMTQIEKLCQTWQKGARVFAEDEHKETMFTPREAEIIELLAEGCRNGEIGNRMHIAQVTVEKNLTNIYRKIGVSNRTGAAKWYNDNYKL